MEVSTTDASQKRSTARLETAQQHGLEKHLKILDQVQALETKLLPSHWWTLDMQEWKDAKRLMAEAEYRHCLDRLEGLIVARLFEFTKLNMSGTGKYKHSIAQLLINLTTGYKLRQHIARHDLRPFEQLSTDIMPLLRSFIHLMPSLIGRLLLSMPSWQNLTCSVTLIKTFRRNCGLL